MQKFIFLDQDGILADFNKGCYETHKRSNPYDNPESLGVFNIEKIWGVSPEEFWNPIDALGVSFWENLDKTPDADYIVQRATDMYGVDNIAVLTAPNQSGGCYIGKAKWIQKHYPQFNKKIIFANAGAKRFLAGPGRILVDDRNENVDDFNKSGGYGFLWPRKWNRRFTETNWNSDNVWLFERSYIEDFLSVPGRWL